MTRNSITSQVKAISMIVAIEGLIPDRRAGSSENKSAPPLPQADIYRAEWLREQQAKTIDPQPDPALAQEGDDPGLTEPELTPVPEAPHRPIGPAFNPSESAFASLFRASENAPLTHASAFVSAPATRAPFSIRNNPFARRR
jgi:hypothetical protein